MPKLSKRLSIGIYKIENLNNGKVYIGQSINVYNRCKGHRFALRHNNHSNTHLQRSWNKHGEKRFRFSVLKTCSVNQLDMEESKFIGMYRSYDSNFGYNLTTGGGTKGYKFSKEVKCQMSLAAQRVARSPEGRKLRSERAKAMHAAGRITYHKKLPPKPKICTACKELFIPPLTVNGGPSHTKWCNNCRPPHYGGYYKTAVKVSVGTNPVPVVRTGSLGNKHTEGVRHIISLASKRMWANRKAKYNQGAR